ncbi:molybdopterin oxidoreductase [Denitrovibrio acetiphilus DSM 12809]|uniref:Molybdopterin oxidoreductase n=1 Tax=Denitrovibrio acetiphilus (strain DSM 12809 / NBRC 114555 / N2460) TaxID=522772 RepID=D4H275_DENA2|nr:molybdopterin-dependent oxidoreductase [Denitrovibrio acetiphilus]ADD68866.1 molybdopterin oxidoreductase [Denitrovibrio acetiphilus DSM 12809]
MKSIQLSRRSVLKAASIAGVASVVGINLSSAKAAELSSTNKMKNLMQDGWRYGHCRMCMRGTCPNMIRVENGVAVQVMGNFNTPTSKGALCAKGNSIIQHNYNPYRVKAPMKRTNPKKGLNEDPGWVEISWEEALNTTASVLKKSRDRDPRRFIFQIGFGDFDFFGTFLFYFSDAYGTPNNIKSNGTLCVLHYASDLCQGVFPGVKPDATHCKYILALGMNLGMGIASSDGGVRGLLDRMYEDKDIKIVMVDPHCGPDASKNEWVPIRPGGETAFLLGVVNSILYDVKRYDVDFLQWRTNAPYLIGPDGYYARGKDGKPQIYDASDGKVKSFDDKTLKEPSIEKANVMVNGVKADASFVLIKRHYKQYTPEWASEKSGIPASKIREIARDFIDNASIGESIEMVNGKGEKVVLPKRTSVCEGKRGLKNLRDGVSGDLLTKTLNMLVGSMDVPGGMLGTQRGPFLSPDEDGVVAAKGEARLKKPSYPPQHVNLKEYFPHKHTLPTLAYKVALDPHKYGLEYEIDALLTVGSNPIASTTEPYVVAESVSKIPFSATVAYHYDEMAHMADILLPSHAMLEKESVNSYEGAFDVYTKETISTRVMMYRDPIPSIYNTMQPQNIIIELCDRMGMINDFNDAINNTGVILGEVTFAKLDPKDYLKHGKKYTISEIWDKGAKAYFGKGLDTMKKDGLIINVMAPADAYNSSWFKKGETRHPIYFNKTKESGDILREFFTEYKDKVYIPDFDMENQLQYYEPMVTWRPKKISEAKKGSKYDLLSINWKLPISPMRVAGDDQMPYLNEVGEKFDPSYGKICLNSITAKEKGIKEGDTIWVESENGKVKGDVHITEMIFPGVVGFGGALGRLVKTLGKKAASFPMYNKLTNAKISDCDPISVGVSNTVPVRIYKA